MAKSHALWQCHKKACVLGADVLSASGGCRRLIGSFSAAFYLLGATFNVYRA
jgi:hypothetical protein